MFQDGRQRSRWKSLVPLWRVLAVAARGRPWDFGFCRIFSVCWQVARYIWSCLSEKRGNFFLNVFDVESSWPLFDHRLKEKLSRPGKWVIYFQISVCLYVQSIPWADMENRFYYVRYYQTTTTYWYSYWYLTLFTCNCFRVLPVFIFGTGDEDIKKQSNINNN